MAEVVWTEPALNCLDEIADYIAIDNPQAASKVVKKVFEKTEKLEITPLMGKVPKELNDTPYRQLVINPVYVYYRYDGNNAIIVYVERQERDIELFRLYWNEQGTTRRC
tara:strand:- start:129 stop:455 length:327 start_codon:yes stop_codon:yes gene_type:complete